MKSADGCLTEADVYVNDTKLDFAQSMTLRVAIGSFLMCCENTELGSIGPLYAARCREILAIIHDDVKTQTVSKHDPDDNDGPREVLRLESALRFISKNSDDPETVRDLISRALRGKSLP